MACDRLRVCGPRPGPGARRPLRPATSSPVLVKASAYLSGYVKALSSVVSEERYEQVLTRKGDSLTAGMTLSRTLLSDYLLVVVAGTGEWMPFRDVYSVDGVPVRDRSDRLLRLFVEAPPDAYKQALRIRDESSRYNIGDGHPGHQRADVRAPGPDGEWRSGFTFKLKGRERLGETDTVVVEYVETARRRSSWAGRTRTSVARPLLD